MEFVEWIKEVVKADNRFLHLLTEDCQEEQSDFYYYYSKGLTPDQALDAEKK